MRSHRSIAVVWTIVASLVVGAPAAGLAEEAPADGHLHGDLEEAGALHLEGSDLLTARDAAMFGAVYFNESAGCGEPRGVLPPLTTTDSSSNRSIPSGHQVRGPWGDFFGRDYGDVSGSMVGWTVPMSGGTVVKVHERALPAFEQVTKNLAAEAAKGRRYDVRIAGSWVWRRIGGLYRMSTHSFGATIDINWDRNPYRSDNTLVSDMPEWFVDAWRDAGFCWGGDWHSVKDPMHFSWKGPQATPGYGSVPRPYAAKTSVAGYGTLAAQYTTAFGSLDAANTYTFFDGNADAAPDVFRVEPWGDDDLQISFARSSRDFLGCGVSTAVFEGGARNADQILVADHAGTTRADIWAIDHSGANLKIRVGLYADRYQDPKVVTTDIRSDAKASYLAGDHNRDGVPDLYVVHRGSATTVDVYNGARDFGTRLYQGTIDVDTRNATRWRFDLTDRDLDGRPDLVVVDVDADVRVRVYSGSSKLSKRITNQISGAPAHPDAVYEMEDWDGDGRGDLMVLMPAGKVQIYLGGVQTGSDTFWFQPSDWRCGASGSEVPWDFNGDRIADLVVGIPGEDTAGLVDSGAFSILYGTKAGPTSSGSQRWHQDTGSLGSPVETGDRFGSAMAYGDFDSDGYVDLAVGAPRDGVGDIAKAGVVNVVPGSRFGLTDVDSVMLHRDLGGVAGTAKARAQFGSSLATGDFNGDGWDDLAVGAPGDKVVYQGAGSVSVFYGSKQGLVASGSQMWSQASSGVKGSPRKWDRFGAALAAGDFNDDGFTDLAIGAPTDRVGGARSGSVTVLLGGAKGLSAIGVQRYSQSSDAVPGSAVNGNRYGMALAAADFDLDGRDDLAVGIPGQSVAGAASAGAVHVMYGRKTGPSTVADAYWHSDRSGVPGTAETGDVFGRSLAAGDFNRDGFADLAVGHPRESIPSATSTGAVTVLYGSGSGIAAAGADLWLQGHDGLPASPESGDWFGEHLRAADLDGDSWDDLIVGLPREDLEVDAAGVVMVIYGEDGGLQPGGAQIWFEESPGLTGTAKAGDSFGKL